MAHCGAELIERKTTVIMAKYIYIESAIIGDFFSAEKGFKKRHNTSSQLNTSVNDKVPNKRSFSPLFKIFPFP